MRCWVGGQIEGVNHGAFGAEGGVRQAGSGGELRGCHGVSCQVGEGVPYCGGAQ